MILLRRILAAAVALVVATWELRRQVTGDPWPLFRRFARYP